MKKFGRRYELQVQANSATGQLIVIKPPFTLEFDIDKKLYSNSGDATLRVYNLSQLHRNQLRKDDWDYDFSRTVTLKAGYGTNLPTVFTGTINKAFSNREGVNFITQIETHDGGFAAANAVTGQTIPEETTQDSVLKTLIADLKPYGVSFGAIGSYPGKLTRANAYSGPTFDLLRELTGQGFFIDNGKAYCLNDFECIPGSIPVINSASGLLGTPMREQNTISFDILFTPEILMGQLIKLESSTDSDFNGFYKVVEIKHRGIISEAVCGDAITSLVLFRGEQALTQVSA